MTNQMIDIDIWLCDLTYTQQTIAADTIPMGIGSLATYAEAHMNLGKPIRLVKYPETLAQLLERYGVPDVVGFGNYCWNTTLAYRFAELIKRQSPRTVTVFGGPHYPLVADEQEQFLKARPAIDFYLPKEGEVVFVGLLKQLWRHGMDKETVLAEGLKSVHGIDAAGVVHLPPYEVRLAKLDDIPSPYVLGKLDEFFDGKLMPLVQTNRGCPFSCTFCVEGASYYSKVKRYSDEHVSEEIRYIGNKMYENRGAASRNDLFIADSNFGMYKTDLHTCRELKFTRDTYGWPEYINVATGKNKKEQVIEAATIIEGALRLSGSVQSLDEGVLGNIKRKNIEAADLIELGLHAKRTGVNSYSEVILGLPGDSKAAHFDTIRKVMDADFNIILPWQLMLLPGSEMGTDAHKKQYGMEIRYRVLPRCFGHFEALGDEVICAEIEEVCVANNTLSFDDYLECRRLNLFVAIFYNDGVFSSLLKLFKIYGVQPFRWIECMMESKMTPSLERLFEEFREATIGELWCSREELEEFIAQPSVVEKYINGELGRNNLYFFRSVAIVEHIADLRDLAEAAAHKVLREQGKLDSDVKRFIQDALLFHTYRIMDIFTNPGQMFTEAFEYDLIRFEQERELVDIAQFRHTTPVSYQFEMSDSQRESISRHLTVFGRDQVGLARILSRVYVGKLYRQVSSAREGLVAD